MKKILISFFILSICFAITGNAYPADRTTKKYDYKDFSKVEARERDARKNYVNHPLTV